MVIVMKNKKRIRGKCFGITKYVNRNKVLIEISEEMNKEPAEYYSTILHELLHVWVSIMKTNGVKATKEKEHKFIYKVESQIVETMRLLK